MGRGAQSLWKTEGRLLTREIPEIQIKATVQNLDKGAAGIPVLRPHSREVTSEPTRTLLLEANP